MLKEISETRFNRTALGLSSGQSRISHLKTVGEGLQLDLAPEDVKRWTRWGDFESDLEVRRRPRMASNWENLKTPAEVETWLRTEAQAYLAKLTAD